ncbi:MAG: signal peptidase I [Clostridia bacterium]|nr:signal peptidase I [Clostridia bacterium]
MKISIKRVLFNIFAIITVLLTVFVAFLLISGTKVFAVQSNSMLPVMEKNALVFVRPTQFELLQTGDIISAHFPDNDGVFTHRIIEINEQEKQITTKGDYNMSVDPMPTDADRIIGKYWFSVPYLGFAALNINSYHLLYVVEAIALILILIRVILQISQRRKER